MKLRLLLATLLLPWLLSAALALAVLRWPAPEVVTAALAGAALLLGISALMTHRAMQRALAQAARRASSVQAQETAAALAEATETLEEQNVALDLAHRQAHEASRVKSEFLANMSHEIRTPLNGIVGFCRLLERSPLAPRQREWLEQAVHASDTLMTLVNDVLDFSRLEAGCLELEQLPLDMVVLVDEVLALQAPLAHQKGLALAGLVYDDVPAELSGDPTRIRQVLTNLVHNAIKFTERGDVVVRVMLEQQTPGGVTLRVSVTDTGIGLSDAQQRHLFEAYHQAAPSHARRFGGSGLGLSICRQLVAHMGGDIEVVSEPQRGATFSFTLPLQGDATRLRAPELQLAGQRVLIEEPHAATRHALHHLLACWGARPVATLPSDAVPDLLITPLPTTAHDAAACRQRLDTLACPAILLTDTGQPATPDTAPPATGLPHGGELLTRPVSRAALAGVVGRLLGAAVTAGAARGSGQRTGAPNAALQMPAALSILAVDDNAQNRLLMSELLNAPRLALTQAASGEEALALAQQHTFDLVLMDIRMPGMDGVETTRALRQLGERWQRTPVIAVTAHALEEERRRLLASGLDEVLTKPVDMQRLSAVVQRFAGASAPSLAEAVSERGEGVPEAAPYESELPTVDLALGARLAGGKAGLAERLLLQLAESLPESRTAIERAAQDGDDATLLDTVHALNGACRYCGAPRLGLLVESLETRLRTGSGEDFQPLLADLFSAMEDLQRWAQQARPATPP